jgi:hypothetical protein
MSIVYKIHPAIGVGRVGASQEYYIAPSTAGGLPVTYSTPNRNGNVFRDAQNKLLRQGVEFQILAYDTTKPDDPGSPVVVGQNQVSAITWKVQVASKKASWFQFMQHTGSGMGPYDASNAGPPGDLAHNNDQGYATNNLNNPWNAANFPPQNINLPANPLRFNVALGTSADPSTLGASVRQQLILDPGQKTLSGANQTASFDLDPAKYPFLSQLVPFPIATLGSALTDATGSRLVVLPGFGNAGTTDTPVQITAYANNNGWFDDIADGPVTAVVELQSGATKVEAVNAWFSSAPPKYAPEAINMVTMYENMYDVFVREQGYNPALFSGGQFDQTYAPSFPDEVLPILSRPTVYQWFTEMPTSGRTPHSNLLPNGNPGDPGYAASVSALVGAFSDNAFPYVRGRGAQSQPGPAENQPGLMPKLAGDNPLSNFTISKFLGLTQTQYFILSQFANGQYTLGAQTTLPPGSAGAGVQLDRAHLENCVGAPFTPGIEITWITRNVSIYQPVPANPVASDWFRIRARSFGSSPLSLTNGQDNNYATGGGLEPGDLTKYMAQPWQADYNECTNEQINPLPGSANTPIIGSQVTLWWWPVQRPWYVYPKTAQAPYLQRPWTDGFINDVPQDNGMNAPQDVQMVTNWRDLGFIQKVPVPAGSNAPLFQEVERLTANITAYQPPPGSPAQ